MSAKKAAWNRLYVKAKKERIEEMIRNQGYVYDQLPEDPNSWVAVPIPESEIEFHHPNGRINECILQFKVIPRWKHRWIHEHPAQARAKGWLV